MLSFDVFARLLVPVRIKFYKSAYIIYRFLMFVVVPCADGTFLTCHSETSAEKNEQNQQSNEGKEQSISSKMF